MSSKAQNSFVNLNILQYSDYIVLVLHLVHYSIGMSHIGISELGREFQLKAAYIHHIGTSIIHQDMRQYISDLFLDDYNTHMHVYIVLRKRYSAFPDKHQYLDMHRNHEVPLRLLLDAIDLCNESKTNDLMEVILSRKHFNK